MSNDERPLCVDLADTNTINEWFDYWVRKDKRSDGRYDLSETINKIRRLALLGASKAKRNKKAVTKVAADMLQRMADDLRAGSQ